MYRSSFINIYEHMANQFHSSLYFQIANNIVYIERHLISLIYLQTHEMCVTNTDVNIQESTIENSSCENFYASWFFRY